MIKIVDLSLAKEKKQLFKILNENIFDPEDNIILIRSYINRSKRLINLSINKNAMPVFDIFFKIAFKSSKIANLI